MNANDSDIESYRPLSLSIAWTGLTDLKTVV